MKYITLLLFLLFSCKGGIDITLKNSLLKILSENQKIQVQLLSNSELIPDTRMLLEAIKDSKSKTEKSKDLYSKLEKLESTIGNINSKDKEAFFESMSSFSEGLTDILKANHIDSEYHKFYCPMVAKYWVAEGEEIQNPYAPEMRDCGELVK